MIECSVGVWRTEGSNAPRYKVYGGLEGSRQEKPVYKGCQLVSGAHRQLTALHLLPTGPSLPRKTLTIEGSGGGLVEAEIERF